MFNELHHIKRHGLRTKAFVANLMVASIILGIDAGRARVIHVRNRLRPVTRNWGESFGKVSALRKA